MRLLTSFRLRTLIGRAAFFVALFVVIGVLFGFGDAALAQGDFGIDAVDSQIGLSGTSIVLIILRVIRILLGLLGLVLVTMILYAGYTIMTSAGNEEKITRGKTIIRNAVIGTGIILFSFIIVQFVINLLMDVTGLSPDTKQPPGIETFVGIGSLGEVVKDHYPMANQTDVYRNTKIVVTFTEAIDPSSIIENTNNTCWDPATSESTTSCADNDNEYFGDCAEVNGQTVCDALKTDVISVHKLTQKGGLVDGAVMPLDALVAYENGSDAHTFVFRLQGTDLFGNGEADQWHNVTITNDVKNTNDKSIFENHIEDAYEWEFETNTEVDLTPPYVVDVSPNPGQTVEKNRILKISFNEAVDPMTVQGMLGPDSSFSNVVIHVSSTVPVSNIVNLSEDGEVEYLPDYLYTFSEFNDIAQDIDYDPVGQHLYVSYTDGTIAKLDVSGQPEIATLEQYYETAGGVQAVPNDIEYNNGYVYTVGGGNGGVDGALHILSATDFTEVGSYTDLALPHGIAVLGDYAYIADDVEGIKVIDISDPTNPNEVAALSILGGEAFVVRAEGSRLYIGSRHGQQFGVADISTPDAPAILEEITLTKTVDDIQIYGDYAYIAVGGAGMKIVDISNPGSEDGMSVTQFTPQGFGYDGLAVFNISIDGDLLAVGEQKAFKLFDLTETPEAPTLLFSYPSTAEGPPLVLDNFRPIYLLGEYLYVGQINDGLQSYDITADPEEGPSADPLVGVSQTEIEVSGQWKITNGYKSIEFLSSEPCGNNAVNSCGDPIYCLPTACADYDKTCTASYSVMARTATLKEENGDSFVSASLFDGVVDMADNALDSAPNIDQDNGSIIPGSVDFEVFDVFADDPDNPWRHKPPFIGVKSDIDLEELYPDNYWWNFTVINDIDSTSPYIQQVHPGIDQQAVDEYTPVDLYFSKEMWEDSLTNVKLIEYPQSEVGLGYVHTTQNEEVSETFGETVKTITRSILHVEHPARPFGPGDDDFWYFTNVPGKEVKAVNQFCLYPGRGPYASSPQTGLSDPGCEVTYDGDWNITSISDACRPGDIAINPNRDTGCLSTNTGLDTVMPDTQTCIDALSDPQVSKTDS